MKSSNNWIIVNWPDLSTSSETSVKLLLNGSSCRWWHFGSSLWGYNERCMAAHMAPGNGQVTGYGRPENTTIPSLGRGISHKCYYITVCLTTYMCVVVYTTVVQLPSLHQYTFYFGFNAQGIIFPGEHSLFMFTVGKHKTAIPPRKITMCMTVNTSYSCHLLQQSVICHIAYIAIARVALLKRFELIKDTP